MRLASTSIHAYTKTMQNLLPFIQIGLSIVLIGAILMQQRGASLGGSFGGDSASYTSRRGIEKTFFTVTIIVGVLYFASAMAALLLR